MTDSNLGENFGAMLGAAEELAPLVGLLTGLRRQFIDLGWPPEQAGQGALQVHEQVLIAQRQQLPRAGAATPQDAP